jgi:hypothetical protein
MKRVLTLVAVALCLSVLNAFADSVPSDPIIDMEPGGDAIAFTGHATFVIHSTDPCVTGGSDSQFCFFELPTLLNFLPNHQSIISVDLSFNVDQRSDNIASPDGFQVAQQVDPKGFPDAIFTTESTVIAGFVERFTGSTVAPCVPTFSETAAVAPCQDMHTQAFRVRIDSPNFDTAGEVTVDVDANVPEPSSALLLLGGIGALWPLRRRLLARNKPASETSAIGGIRSA